MGCKFLKDCVYLFLVRQEGREKERKRKIDVQEAHTPQPGTAPKTQACALIRNQTGDFALLDDAPLSYTIWAEGNLIVNSGRHGLIGPPI